MFIYSPPASFDPEKHFEDVPLFQGLFFKQWQEACGRKVVTLAVRDTNDVVQVYIQCVEHTLPIVGSFWSGFRGPVGTFPSHPVEEEFYRELRISCAKAGKDISHIRVQQKPKSRYIRTISSERWRGGSLDQPLCERVIPLADDLDDIVKGFVKNTKRYVRQYERDKKDIRFHIEKTDFKSHLPEVHSLIETTATLRGFSLYPLEYYEKLFDRLNANPEYGALVLGYTSEKKEPISVILLIYTNTEAYHLFSGCSSKGYDKNMPTLTLYTAIKEAKKQGLQRYNLGGVSSKEWGGVDSLTAFKEKFGGETITHEQPYDIILSSRRYWLFRFLRLRTVRKARRIIAEMYGSMVVK